MRETTKLHNSVGANNRILIILFPHQILTGFRIIAQGCGVCRYPGLVGEHAPTPTGLRPDIGNSWEYYATPLGMNVCSHARFLACEWPLIFHQNCPCFCLERIQTYGK
jgi:hypothetical protein